MKHFLFALVVFFVVHPMDDFNVTPKNSSLTWFSLEEFKVDQKDGEVLEESMNAFCEYLQNPNERDLADLIPADSQQTLLQSINHIRPTITLYGEDIKVEKTGKFIALKDNEKKLQKPHESIEEIIIDGKNLQFAQWTNTNVQAHRRVVLGSNGTSLCWHHCKNVLVGCEDGTLKKVDGSHVYDLYKIHEGAINTLHLIDNRSFLTRSSDKHECYLWNLCGEKRPRIKLDHADAKTVYVSQNNEGNDLEIVLSHAGTKSKLYSSLDNDKKYTIPHYWLTGEGYSNLTYPQALYIYGLWASLYKKISVSERKELLVNYKKSRLTKTFEPQVAVAFKNYLDEQLHQLSELQVD